MKFFVSEDALATEAFAGFFESFGGGGGGNCIGVTLEGTLPEGLGIESSKIFGSHYSESLFGIS